MTPRLLSRNLIKSSRHGQSVERDDVPEGSSTSVGLSSSALRVRGQEPRACCAVEGVLFENSIVCLVVLFLLLFFCHALALPVCGVWLFLMPVFGVFLFGQVFSDCEFASCVEGFLFGEFDPGSGRTLAACLTHASRTERPCLQGARVANG